MAHLGAGKGALVTGGGGGIGQAAAKTSPLSGRRFSSWTSPKKPPELLPRRSGNRDLDYFAAHVRAPDWPLARGNRIRVVGAQSQLEAWSARDLQSIANIATPAVPEFLKEQTVPTCTHLDTIVEVTPSDDGCHDCLLTGGRWVHLRVCQACGHVGCCDSSPNRHATAHASVADHPVVRSFEPGEDWFFCYPDSLLFELGGAAPAPSHSVGRR